MPASFKVLSLFYSFNVIALEIKDSQMLQESDIEELINMIIVYVELFEVDERLNALHLNKLTSRQVQNSHEAEWSSNVSEASDYRIVHPKGLKTAQDLSSNLKVMTRGINSQLDFCKPWEFFRFDSEMLCEELLIQLDGILYLIVFDYFFKLLQEIREKAYSPWLFVDFLIIVISLWIRFIRNYFLGKNLKQLIISSVISIKEVLVIKLSQ